MASYIKNISRSAMYALPQIIRNKVPSVAALFDQFDKDSRESHGFVFKEMKSILKEDVLGLVSKGLDSAKKEFKSGKFYQTDEEQFASFGGMGDMDFDNSFLDDDFDYNSDDNKKTAKVASSAAAYGAAQGVKSVAAKLNDSPSMRSSAESNMATARYSRANLGATMAMTNALRGAMMANAQINTHIHKFQTTIQHSYYQKQLEHNMAMAGLTSEIVSKLNELKSVSTVAASAMDQISAMTSGSRSSDFTKVFSSSGDINVGAYLGVLKGRMKENLGKDSAIMGLMHIKATAPLTEAFSAALESIIPKTLGKQMEQFNNFFGNIGIALNERARKLSGILYAKGGDKNKNLSAILDMFSISPNRSSSGPDLSRMVRGKPVAFDGYAHRSLVEVIPSQLSDIHAELVAMRSGAGYAPPTDRNLYNYKTGRFASEKKTRQHFERDIDKTSLRHFDNIHKMVGDEGDLRTSRQLQKSFGILRNNNFSLNKGGVQQFAKDIDDQIASLKKSGKTYQAAMLAKTKSRLVEARRKHGSIVSYELQSAIGRSDAARYGAYDDVGSEEGIHRMMYSGQHLDYKRKLEKKSGLESLFNKTAERPKGWTLGREEYKMEKGLSDQSVFKDASGRVTLASILQAPAVVTSKVMMKIQTKISDALFGGNDYDEGTEKTGIIPGIKKKLMSVVDSMKLALIGTVDENGKRSGGYFGATIQKGKDTLSMLKSDINTHIIQPMKTAFVGYKDKAKQNWKDKGLVEKVKNQITTKVINPMLNSLLGTQEEDGLNEDGTIKYKRSGGKLGILKTSLDSGIKKLNEWLQDAMKPLTGLVERTVKYMSEKVINPVKEFVKTELYLPLKKNVLDMWDKASIFMKKEIFNPLREALNPFIDEAKIQWRLLKDWTSGTLVGAIKGVGVEVNNVFKDSFGTSLSDMLRKNILEPIKDALSSVRDFLATTLKSILKFPVNIIKGASDELKASHIRRGVAGYLPLEERNRIIAEHGMDEADLPAGSGSSIRQSGKKRSRWASDRRTRGGVSSVIILGDGTQIPTSSPYSNQFGPFNRGSGNKSNTRWASNRRSGISSSQSNPTDIRYSDEAASGNTSGVGTSPYNNPSDSSNTTFRDDPITLAKNTADNTKNIFQFMTHHLYGVGANVEKIVKHLGIGDISGQNTSGKKTWKMKFREFLADPFGFAGRLIHDTLDYMKNGLVNIFKTAGSIILKPFRLLGSAITHTAEAIGKTLGGAVTIVDSFFRHSFGAVKGVIDVFSGKTIPTLIESVTKISDGFLTIGNGLIKLSGTILSTFISLGKTMIGTAVDMTRDIVSGVFNSTFGAVNALMGDHSTKLGLSRLTPVYVMGGYLAGTEGGAKSLVEAKVGLTRTSRMVAGAVLGGLTGGIGAILGAALGYFSPEVSEKLMAGKTTLLSAFKRNKARTKSVFETASSHINPHIEAVSGGFNNVKQRLSQAAMRLHEFKWRDKLLQANLATETHLKAIRTGFSNVGSMLLLGIPLLVAGIKDLGFFFKNTFLNVIAKIAAGGGLSGLTSSIGGKLSKIPNFLKIGAGIGLAGAGINYLAEKYMDSGAVKQMVKSSGTAMEYGALGATIGSIIPGVGTAVGAGVGAGIGVIAANWDSISNGISFFANKLSELGTYMWESIAGRNAKFDDKGNVLQQGKRSILEDFSAALFGDKAQVTPDGQVVRMGTRSFIGELFGSYFGQDELVTSKGETAREGQLSIVGKFRRSMANTVRSVGHIVINTSKWFDDALASIGNGFKKAGDWFKELPTLMWNHLKKMFNFEWFGNIIKGIGGWFANIPGMIIQGIKSFFSGGKEKSQEDKDLGIWGSVAHFLDTSDPKKTLIGSSDSTIVSRASGGPLGRNTLVGELGPELLDRKGNVIAGGRSGSKFQNPAMVNAAQQREDSIVSILKSIENNSYYSAAYGEVTSRAILAKDDKEKDSIFNTLGNLKDSGVIDMSATREGAFKPRLSGISSVNTSLLSTIANAVSDVGGYVADKAKAVGGAVSEAVGAAKDKAISVGTSLRGAVGGAIGLPSNDITDAIKAGSATSGVDIGYMMAMAKQESGFNPNAKAGQGSAKGLYQFVDKTWNGMVGKYGKQYGIGSGDRFDPKAQATMAGLYAKENGNILKKVLGREANPTELYLGHFLGSGGASSFLKGMANDPTATPGSMAAFSDAANSNPSIFFDKRRPRTFQEIYDMMYSKVGGKAEQYSTKLGVNPSSVTSSASDVSNMASTAAISESTRQATGAQNTTPVSFQSSMSSSSSSTKSEQLLVQIAELLSQIAGNTNGLSDVMTGNSASQANLVNTSLNSGGNVFTLSQQSKKNSPDISPVMKKVLNG